MDGDGHGPSRHSEDQVNVFWLLGCWATPHGPGGKNPWGIPNGDFLVMFYGPTKMVCFYVFFFCFATLCHILMSRSSSLVDFAENVMVCFKPNMIGGLEHFLFPTCQVRVVRFYVSCLLRPPPASCALLRPPASCVLRPPAACLLLVLSSSSSSNCDLRSTAFPAGPQPRPSTPSVLCRTSTTTIPAQCSLPDLNHDHPRPVQFPAGPQPRASPPSVPCRTSTTTIPAQCCRTSTASIRAKCSLPDLNREYPRQVFPAGPHVGRYGTKNVQKRVRKNVRKNVRRYARRCAR